MLFGAFFILSGSVAFGHDVAGEVLLHAEAATACDREAKPAFSCPTGYSVMCIPVGTPHWGCGKESAGVIIEASPISAIKVQSAQPTLLQTAPVPATGVLETPQTTSESEDFNYLATSDRAYEIEIGKGEVFEKVFSAETPLPGIYLELGTIKGESEEKQMDSDDDATINSSEAELETSGNVEYEWKVEEGEKANKPKEIIVVGGKVRGWDPKTKEEIVSVAPSTATEVVTDEDLALFVTAGTLKTEMVEEVSINYKKIKVSAGIPAKLFGLVPTSISTTLVIERDAESNSYGRVKVQFPWWHILTAKLVSEQTVQSLYEEEVKKSGSSVTVDLENLQQEMAQQFQTLSNVMKTMHDTAKSIIQNIRA